MKKLQSGIIKEVLTSSNGEIALLIELETGEQVLKLATEVEPVK